MTIKKVLAGVTLTAAIVGYKAIRPSLGKIHLGKRAANILKSPNFNGKKFENQVVTPIMTLERPYLKNMFSKEGNTSPKNSIPFILTSLEKLKQEDNYYIWFGHSSYLLKISGITYLVDPVLSGSASPFSQFSKAYTGADYYKPEMLPEIDYLIISHDHYDHLDYDTVKKLKDKVKKVIVPLGVADHFVYWGYDKEKVTELDWYDEIVLENNSKLISTPARHAAGRLIQGSTLWSSYVLDTDKLKIFIGGDSSYGDHFKKIGSKYGPFDFAILENGQYNKMWKHNHMFPEETLLASEELGAKNLIPVHNSKFTLALHSWNRPLEDLVVINEKKYNKNILTPKIGELLSLDKEEEFTCWWR